MEVASRVKKKELVLGEIRAKVGKVRVRRQTRGRAQRTGGENEITFKKIYIYIHIINKRCA